MENTNETLVPNNETTEVVNTNSEVDTTNVETTENAEVKETPVKKEPFNPLANYKDMPINKEALEEQNKTFSVLKAEVEKLVATAENTEEFKAIRKQIIELKEKVLALFLISKAEKDVLIDKLQQSFVKLNERQEELKKNIDEVYTKNLDLFKVKYDEAINFVKETSEFKAARERLIELQKELKGTQLKRDEKDKLFAQIQEFFEGVNKKQAEYRESFEAEFNENLGKIMPRVEEVLNNVKSLTIFKDARQQLIDLQNELKGLRIKREKKDEIFSTIREAFNDLNARQDEERKAFDSVADANYATIKPEVLEAVEFAKTNVEPSIAREKLIQTQAKLKDLQLRRTQRDELYGMMREVFESLTGSSQADKEQFEKEANENYGKLEIKVSEAIANVEYSNDFKDIREGLIAVQDEIKIVRLKKDQRNELFKRIRKAFEIFDAKRNEYMDKRRSEKSGKLSQILVNLKDRLSKLEEYETNDKNALAQVEAKLAENAGDEVAAAEKINLLDKINERVEKLNDIKSRIESIEKELNEGKE